MSCVILLMRLGCFPSLLLKINDIRQGSSLLFFSYSPICLTNLQNWELDVFLFTFFALQGTSYPAPAYHGAGGGTMRNGYDEAAAVAYARRWALLRNPAYLDFHGLGGDCTNFVSQCLYAGAGVMNRTPVYGWYYLTGNDRTASWTGVEYLYRFLTANKGPGPYAQEVGREDAVPGDVVQLGDPSGYTHAALIVDVRQGECYVAAHTLDSWMRPLSSYRQPARRFLHILGVRGRG